MRIAATIRPSPAGIPPSIRGGFTNTSFWPSMSKRKSKRRQNKQRWPTATHQPTNTQGTCGVAAKEGTHTSLLPAIVPASPDIQSEILRSPPAFAQHSLHVNDARRPPTRLSERNMQTMTNPDLHPPFAVNSPRTPRRPPRESRRRDDVVRVRDGPVATETGVHERSLPSSAPPPSQRGHRLL